MRIRKILILSALMALLSCCLTGCLFVSIEELYALPQLSEDYYDLQDCLDAVLTGSAEYSAPVSGSQQQSVQLVDLSGDGEKEALAFVKATGEKPLKIYIFHKVDGAYTLATVIEGDGSAFQSVEYAQVGGSDALELIVCWQVSDQVPQALGVYTFAEDFTTTELLNASCTEYQLADLDSDGAMELLLLSGSDGGSGAAELYSWIDGMVEKVGESQMSVSVDAVRRIITGNMEEGVPAIFVASTYDETSIVTDVFALRDGQLVNVAASSQSEGGVQTVRNYYVYATDVDSDGVLELPMPIQLPSADAESTETYWIIQWYSLHLDGSTTNKRLTYHNYSAGWYLELPDSWRDRITVYRSDTAYVFAAYDSEDGSVEPLFSITAVSDGSEDAEGTVLAEQNGTVFYLTIADNAQTWSAEITEEGLSQRFHMIQTDWYTGEM